MPNDHAGDEKNISHRRGVINVPSKLPIRSSAVSNNHKMAENTPTQTSIVAASVLPPAFLVIVILLATVVGMTLITIIPTSTYLSMAPFPETRTQLTIANTMAEKKRKENICVNKWSRQLVSWWKRAGVESVRPVIRNIAVMTP